MPRDEPEPASSKFVIRKLPPELTEDTFHTLLRNVCQDELEWFRYHPGNTGDAGIATSTAFFKLRHPELAPILKQVLQNAPFIGEHGVPYHCEMEVAVYQRIPKERAKEDPYAGTYEQDPYYIEFLNQIEKEDEAAKKGPVITATTTIVEEEADKEPVVTPLMHYIINRYKSSSGRSRSSKGASGDGREKENRKRMQVIAEEPAGGKQTDIAAGKTAPGKRGKGAKREERSGRGKDGVADKIAGSAIQRQEGGQGGKAGRGKGSKPQIRDATASSSGAAGPSIAAAANGGAPLVVSSADMAAAKSAAQAAARVAMQLDAEKRGPLSTVPNTTTAPHAAAAAATNGSSASPAKATPKHARTSRRARGRGGGGRDTDGVDYAAPGTPGHPKAAGADDAGRPSPANERAIAAAAAAATAALQDSAPGERPRPRTRPAIGARGVRDALLRAGIKQPSAAAGGSKGPSKSKALSAAAERGAGIVATSGDAREAGSGP